MRDPIAAGERGPGVMAALGLVALAFLIYLPVWNGSAVFDDDAHLIPAWLQSTGGLAQIWTSPGTTQEYYPVTFTVLWVEAFLWGHWTLPYHLVNIALHLVAVYFFFRALRFLRIPGAALAACLLVVHPVMVESVAWITEIKNTLSGAFFFAALYYYLRFDRDRSRAFHAAAFVLFCLGVMAKTVAVMLPVDLLVLFWWQRGRLSWRQDMVPLLPFFAVSAGMGLYIRWYEEHYCGAMGGAFAFSFGQRMLIAGHAFWFYLGKLIAPFHLIFVYPRWQLDVRDGRQWVYPVLFLVVGFLAWRDRHRQRAPWAVYLLFVITLFPVLGFLNVYWFRFSFVADHFQYLAAFFVIAAAAAGVETLLRGEGLWGRTDCRVAGAMLLLLLAFLAGDHAAAFRSRFTLYQTVLEANPTCWMAYNNMGHDLFKIGKGVESIPYSREAVRLYPGYPEAQYNLGRSLLATGDLAGAVPSLQLAVKLDGGQVEPHRELARAWDRAGRSDLAVEQYGAVLQLKPDDFDARSRRGLLLLRRGDEGAAATDLARADALKPGDATVSAGLGLALMRQGDWRGAIAAYEEALRSDPANFWSYRNLAWIRATSPIPELRKGDEAVRLAEKADRLSGGDDPAVLRVLAAAYAAKGRFTEAVAALDRALAESEPSPGMARALLREKKLYATHQVLGKSPRDPDEEE